MTSLSNAVTPLGACSAPSEAFWRLLELDAVRRAGPQFRHPVLEVGCGDGVSTRPAASNCGPPWAAVLCAGA